MSKAVGIDLGTTSSRVAIIHEGKPVIIENKEGEGTTPSHIGVTSEGRRLVGEVAQRYALQFPKSVAFAVKRLIGRRFTDPQVQKIAQFVPYKIVEATNGDAWIELEGRQFAPSQLSAFTLLKMKETAEQFLRAPVTEAVVTVPAYFLDSQRQATRDAAEIAGLKVLRLIPEPVAAALSYGFGNSELSQTILVYDLGGGTFDVSVLEISGGVFEVKATSGDTFLGGEDFDYALAEYFADQFSAKTGIKLYGDPIAVQRLKQAAEDAKIELSTSTSSHVELPFIHYDGKASHHFTCDISRQKLESLIAPFIGRSIKICDQALLDSGLTKGTIDSVVLVGGSTRIPLVQRRIREFFNTPVFGGLRREDAVALGAAIEAGILKGDVKGHLLLKTTPFSLGLETAGGVFTRLIGRNTTVPTKTTQTFSTAENNQTAVTIKLYQGEQDIAAENHLLGQFDLLGIPPAQRGVPQIEVTFEVDANGLLHVYARDKATRREQLVHVRTSGGLTEQDISGMAIDAQSVGLANVELAVTATLATTPPPKSREDPNEPPPSIVARTPNDIRHPNRPRIFVSYAHEDVEFAQIVQKAFKAQVRAGKLDLWSDRQIGAGELWEREIFSALEKANIAILLLSFDFLNSDFIARKELPAIFAERERRRLTLIPILVRPCPFDLHEDLAKFQLFNRPEAPFSSLEDWEIETELVRLARHIGKNET